MANSQPKQIEMIVGLGNPGLDYEKTRHNAGFMTIDALADRLGVSYWKSQCGAEVGVTKFQGRQVILAKPQSFMNLSGGPVSKLCREYDLEPEQILVVHDELDIPAGDLRVKFAGGHAGHNGIRSIIDKCQSRDFTRLRFGIGRPPGKMPVADYVLQQLKNQTLEDFIFQTQDAADVLESCLSDGVTAARDKYNGLHKSETKQ